MDAADQAKDSSTTRAGDVGAFLAAQPPTTLQRLYARPSACLAVFRLLPPLAQQYILRMLMLGGSGDTSSGTVSLSTIEQWSHRGKPGKPYTNLPSAKHRDALEAIRKFRLIVESTVDGQSESPSVMVALQPLFREEMLNALTMGRLQTSLPDDKADTSGTFGKEIRLPQQDQLDPSFLDKFAGERWENILHFMVGQGMSGVVASAQQLSPNVLQLLCESGLMSREPARNTHSTSDGGDAVVSSDDGPVPLHITNRGFQFLLQDVSTQIWSMLLNYVKMAEKLGLDRVELLALFLQLGMLDGGSGRTYSSQGMEASQLRLLPDLRDFGIVYWNEDSDWFCPTRLAASLATSSGELDGSAVITAAQGLPTSPAGRRIDVVVETNYRVYAYTDSPLQIAILGLFVQLRCRFSNLIVGAITRDSVRAALANGITAAQIVHYLSSHAHSQTRASSGPALPPTVVDQVNLWEMERDRLKFKKGYLYREFSSDQFEPVLRYARDLGVVLWHSSGNGTSAPSMMIEADGHQAVREFVKNLIASGSQSAARAE